MVDRLILPYHHPDQPYRPDEEGFIVICEDGDQDGPLKSIWPDEPYTLADIPWEGALLRPYYKMTLIITLAEYLHPHRLTTGHQDAE